MKKSIMVLVIIKIVVIISWISYCNTSKDDLNILGKNVTVFVEGKKVVSHSFVLEYDKDNYLKLRHNDLSNKYIKNDLKPELSKIEKHSSFMYIHLNKIKYYRILVSDK